MKSKSQFNSEIFKLAGRLVTLKKKAASLGLFTGDRELLSCPRCGLEEDVEAGGRLIVRWSVEKTDTRLRFEPLGRSKRFFRCPACRSRIRARWW